MLMLSKPCSLAMAKAFRISSTVWRLPIRFRVSSRMVWGLMEIRVTGWARRTASFAGVMLSGRPPSTVNSRRWE